jgi:hypothetical protein
VNQRRADQVFVVPAEPLAKLATTAPHDGVIARTTVAAANFALWRVHVFNQLAGQLTDFNARHVVEITSKVTSQMRRDELANAAAGLSEVVHGYGIGPAWSLPDGKRGWYGALVDQIDQNMRDLQSPAPTHGFVASLVGRVAVLAGRCLRSPPGGRRHRRGRDLASPSPRASHSRPDRLRASPW